MELFIGGAFQGKTEYVKGLYPDRVIIDESHPVFLKDQKNKDEIIEALLNDEIILNHFHLIIRALQKAGFSQEDMEHLFLDGLISQKLIIISDEIGCGIVPIDRSEREFREITGRLLIKIAKISESVVRITCQIPMKLK